MIQKMAIMGCGLVVAAAPSCKVEDRMPNPRLIYAIFEGGGAKGIAHLGAVEAVEKLNLAFAGVAGASAGAFVAALLAAGYRSNELLNPSTPTSNLLATHGFKPLDLLGDRKWHLFNGMLSRAGWLAKAAMLAGVPGALCVGPRAMVTLAVLRHGLGHFSTDEVRDFVNARVRERLRDLWADAGRDPDKVPDPVRFADLDYETFQQLRPLKIIATDVLQMRPILFDRVRTPNVPIGDAVAASIAIPVVFRPVTVRGLPPDFGRALFVDGGLVSNLPFWVFGEEKMAVERANPADPPVPIVAFTLKDEAPPPAPRGPLPGGLGQWRFFSKAALNGAVLGLGVALIGWAARYLATGATGIEFRVIGWMIACVAFFALANMTWGRVRIYGQAAFTGGLVGVVVALACMIVWSLVTRTHTFGAAVEAALLKLSEANAWIGISLAVFAGLNVLLSWRAHRRSSADAPPSFFPFVTKTLRTGIFGSQVVAQSLLRDVVQVPLVTRLTVFGFDRPWPDIREDYISGRQCALHKLRTRLQKRPVFLDGRLRETVVLARAELTKLRGLAVGQLRACVIEPFGGQSLRVTHGYNMENDADDRLTLDVRGEGAGKAYRSGDVVAISLRPGYVPPFMTKYERALLRPTLRSILCIPIFDHIEAWERNPADRPQPLGVLAIDSDEDLSVEFATRDFIDFMAGPAVLLSPAFKME
jgi:predicted acylesterase/phospholipase RssA